MVQTTDNDDNVDIDFNEVTALEAAESLQEVLASRVHKKKYLGQITVVPGQLGSALNLPKIVAKLSSKVSTRRAGGLEEFMDLWVTLSEPTRKAVLEKLGWYDPDSLEWEDKRSNRKPRIK